MKQVTRWVEESPFRAGLGLFALLAVALILAAPQFEPEQYQGFTGALQAAGLVVALFLAYSTFLGDSRDRRVDRVLALHAELTSGDIQTARVSLVNFLRDQSSDDRVARMNLTELRASEALGAYVGATGSPRKDANLILRFFERADAARRAGSLFDPLAHELLGRHSTWLRLALCRGGEPLCDALVSFADWADDYTKTEAFRRSRYADRWGTSTRHDFGASYRDIVLEDAKSPSAQSAPKRPNSGGDTGSP